MMKNVRSEFKKHQAKSKKRGDNNDSDDDMSVDSNRTNMSY